MPSNNNHETLKLIALDRDDLTIISAHAQDAVIKLADMIYVPSEQRFAAVMSRFDWVAAEGENDRLRRCQSALRFDRVRRAQVQNMPLDDHTAVAELLAVTYDEVDPPGGYITLYFSGGGAIRLEVECIEAELRDLGAAWRTTIKPQHQALEREGLPQGVAASHGGD
jgi:hypothetical protein